MKNPLSNLILLGMALVVLACGKNPVGAQSPAAAAASTLNEQIESYSQTNGSRSAVSAGADYGGGVISSAARFLDGLYGKIPPSLA